MVHLVVAKVVYMEVEMVDKEARGGGSLGGFSVGSCRKQGRRRSKMKGERRRWGIYRIWIVKVMQLNKREGVFVKLGELGGSLSWPAMMMRGEWGCLGNDILEEKN